MSALIDGLGVGEQLLVIGAAADPINATPVQLIMGRQHGVTNADGFYQRAAAK
jgi:hypothetical protein